MKEKRLHPAMAMGEECWRGPAPDKDPTQTGIGAGNLTTHNT